MFCIYFCTFNMNLSIFITKVLKWAMYLDLKWLLEVVFNLPFVHLDQTWPFWCGDQMLTNCSPAHASEHPGRTFLESFGICGRSTYFRQAGAVYGSFYGNSWFQMRLMAECSFFSSFLGFMILNKSVSRKEPKNLIISFMETS